MSNRIKLMIYFVSQRQTLIEKLENYKIEHQDKENEIVIDISSMNKKIDEVKSNLETRTRDLGLIYEVDETDHAVAEPAILHELRRSCSVPSEPNTPDCEVFQDCNPMNQSYSTLTVDKGVIKFGNSTKQLEESASSISNDAVDSASLSAIVNPSGHELYAPRKITPPPNYSESTLFHNTRTINIDYS